MEAPAEAGARCWQPLNWAALQEIGGSPSTSPGHSPVCSQFPADTWPQGPGTATSSSTPSGLRPVCGCLVAPWNRFRHTGGGGGVHSQPARTPQGQNTGSAPTWGSLDGICFCGLRCTALSENGGVDALKLMPPEGTVDWVQRGGSVMPAVAKPRCGGEPLRCDHCPPRNSSPCWFLKDGCAQGTEVPSTR